MQHTTPQHQAAYSCSPDPSRGTSQALVWCMAGMQCYVDLTATTVNVTSIVTMIMWCYCVVCPRRTSRMLPGYLLRQRP
jgi:hypothetical protein